MAAHAALEATGSERIRERGQGRVVASLFEALAELNVDVAAVRERVGASEYTRHGHGAWPASAFWSAVVDVSGTSGIGAKLAERLHPSDFGLLGKLVTNSATLGEALLHGLRLSRLGFTGAQLAMYADGERTTVVVESASHASLHPEEVDFVVTSGVLAARSLIARDFAPIEVSFAHDPPADTSHHRRILRAPLRFCATQTACSFSTALLLSALPNGSALLRSTLADEAEKRIAACSVDLPRQTHAAILAELRHGDPSIKRVAARMGTYPRMLTRKLHAAGLSYRELLGRTRLELAEQYLHRPGIRITAIAELLGYSDKSAFVRAFKRQTGCAPLEYRQRLQALRSEEHAPNVRQEPCQ